MSAADEYKALWSAKTTKQIEKELQSWQRHFAKHERAYSWHDQLTAPGQMSDGDRVNVLKDILRERGESEL